MSNKELDFYTEEGQERVRELLDFCQPFYDEKDNGFGADTRNWLRSLDAALNSNLSANKDFKAEVDFIRAARDSYNLGEESFHPGYNCYGDILSAAEKIINFALTGDRWMTVDIEPPVDGFFDVFIYHEATDMVEEVSRRISDVQRINGKWCLPTSVESAISHWRSAPAAP